MSNHPIDISNGFQTISYGSPHFNFGVQKLLSEKAFYSYCIEPLFLDYLQATYPTRQNDSNSSG